MPFLIDEDNETKKSITEQQFELLCRKLDVDCFIDCSGDICLDEDTFDNCTALLAKIN